MNLVSCPINNMAFVAIKMGRRQGGPSRTGSRSGAYLNRYVTDEQRSRRPIFIAMAPAKAPRGGMVLEVTNKEPKGEMDESTSKRKPLPRPGGDQPARQDLTSHHKRALAGAQK
jgi:hypothetical protein